MISHFGQNEGVTWLPFAKWTLADFEKSKRTVRMGISDNKGERPCFAYASGSCHTASDLNHPSCWIDVLSIDVIISMGK